MAARDGCKIGFSTENLMSDAKISENKVKNQVNEII